MSLPGEQDCNRFIERESAPAAPEYNNLTHAKRELENLESCMYDTGSPLFFPHLLRHTIDTRGFVLRNNHTKDAGKVVNYATNILQVYSIARAGVHPGIEAAEQVCRDIVERFNSAVDTLKEPYDPDRQLMAIGLWNINREELEGYYSGDLTADLEAEIQMNDVRLYRLGDSPFADIRALSTRYRTQLHSFLPGS